MTDEHGMPVAGDETPLPWKVERDERITDRCGCRVESDCNGFPETLHFIVHAANNIIPCREIVRRLAEPDNLSLGEIESVIRDATILWSKMLKGAADES